MSFHFLKFIHSEIQQPVYILADNLTWSLLSASFYHSSALLPESSSQCLSFRRLRLGVPLFSVAIPSYHHLSVNFYTCVAYKKITLLFPPLFQLVCMDDEFLRQKALLKVCCPFCNHKRLKNTPRSSVYVQLKENGKRKKDGNRRCSDDDGEYEQIRKKETRIGVRPWPQQQMKKKQDDFPPNRQ